MRDIIVLLFTLVSALFAFIEPWIGVLALAIFGYLNPHTYAWGFSRTLPVYQAVFIFAFLGLMKAKDRQPFPWTRETGLFVILLIYFTITTVLSPDYPSEAHAQWLKVMKIYAGIFPTLWLITSRNRLRWLMIAIAGSFGLLGLKGGIFSLVTGFHYRVYGPAATFYNGNNEIGLALCITLPLLLLCAKEVNSKLVKMLFYGSFVFSICAIISTWSRGGFLALCAVLAAIILTGKRKWLSIPFLAIGIYILIPMLPQQWFNRMQTISTYEKDGSAMGRIDSWEFAVDRAVKSPLTGGGFASFTDRTDSHSAYFQILAHHGFVALGLWLSLLLGTMIALGRVRRKAILVDSTAWIGPYARAVQIALLGYAVGSAFLGTAYWDIFYHLAAVCALLKVQLVNAKAVQENTESNEGFSAVPAQSRA
jgi:putative inorganic carbon (hco3(-)) transporter